MFDFVVTGWGAQARAQAENLRDSGCRVAIALRPNSASRKDAEQRFPVVDFREAPAAGRGVILLIPDLAHEAAARVWKDRWSAHNFLVLAHGLSWVLGVWRDHPVDILLAAPKAIATALRKAYRENASLHFATAVLRDVSGAADKRLEAYLQAVLPRARSIRVTAEAEVLSDLFSEQAFLCGGLLALLAETYRLLRNAGIPAELAYVECVDELAYIAEALREYGPEGLFQRISPAAQVGATLWREPFRATLRPLLTRILGDLQKGAFLQLLRDHRRRENLLQEGRDFWKNQEITGIHRKMRVES